MRIFSQTSERFVFSVIIVIIFVSTVLIPSANGLLQQQQATTLLGVSFKAIRLQLTCIRHLPKR
jgi:hypothetical protein